MPLPPEVRSEMVAGGLLRGKCLVVVGATSGLGLSAAAGATVVAVGLHGDDVARAAGRLGREARVVAGDATVPDVAPAAIERAAGEFGAFYGLYHVGGSGSGRGRGDGPLHDLGDDGWDFTLRLNLTSLFYSNRASVRPFLRQGTGGSVLNMGSVLARSPSPEFFATHAYAAAVFFLSDGSKFVTGQALSVDGGWTVSEA